METQQEYVIRKLGSPEFNIAEVARQIGIDRVTLIRIRDGDTKNPGARTIQPLYDYFKALSE
jgi:transcriptional regulator with XRE-family HTH domain